MPIDPNGGPWPFHERRAVLLLIGTCRGLLEMHESGVSHRYWRLF
jgi:hypothetical protein